MEITQATAVAAFGILSIWGISWLTASRKSAKQEGKDEVKAAQLRRDISELKESVNHSEKELAEKVSLTLFKEEIAEIHGRISNTQKAQAEAMEKQGAKIDKISDGLAEIKGMLKMLPARLAGHDKSEAL